GTVHCAASGAGAARAAESWRSAGILRIVGATPGSGSSSWRAPSTIIAMQPATVAANSAPPSHRIGWRYHAALVFTDRPSAPRHREPVTGLRAQPGNDHAGLVGAEAPLPGRHHAGDAIGDHMLDHREIAL